MVTVGAVSRISENFIPVKNMISSLAQILHRLYDIDWVFKKYTGYPTTWFFNSSVFYDFLYSFENLIKSLIKTASIESGFIEPLLVWKVKTTGV